MIITTKYSQGDIVWTIKDGRPFQFAISQITVSIFHGQYIGYAPNESPFRSGKYYMEEDCHETKEAMIESFKNG